MFVPQVQSRQQTVVSTGPKLSHSRPRLANIRQELPKTVVGYGRVPGARRHGTWRLSCPRQTKARVAFGWRRSHSSLPRSKHDCCFDYWPRLPSPRLTEGQLLISVFGRKPRHPTCQACPALASPHFDCFASWGGNNPMPCLSCTNPW